MSFKLGLPNRPVKAALAPPLGLLLLFVSLLAGAPIRQSQAAPVGAEAAGAAVTPAPPTALAAAAMNEAISKQASSNLAAASTGLASTNATVASGTGSVTVSSPPGAEAEVKTASAGGTTASVSGQGAAVSVGTQAKSFDQYFEPICKQLDKLSDRQLFKIQTQVKKFVELVSVD